MPSDRERLTYDANQKYRSVVAQQGRVTLAADFNEAEEIFGEEVRSEALDFVGPAGTPDDGYAITFNNPSPKSDFNISPGTMYVGGQRVTLPPGVTYFKQSDWLDASPAGTPSREYIYLSLEEREVSAVEDSALREVALGGPDTGQRTRLLQRIARANTSADNCAAALDAQKKVWESEGWQFDAKTMRLNSAARLQVGFDTSDSGSSPCEPAASGGYLRADNQLIRVRISGAGKFVWGFDNASFLYRVDVVDDQTVKFQTPPVDLFHYPASGQAVELLRAEARLANGEYVAYGEGKVMTLADAYVADGQTLKLPSAIPAEYKPAGGTPRLFLRVWQKEENYAPGTAVTLGDTGLTVTVTTPASIHTGDFWVFAARPSTPVKLYQSRYTEAPQPPEGPRRWVCPLAVITWAGATNGNYGTLAADCREKFDNLVELTKRKPSLGCCTVTLKPSDLDKQSLNDVIKALPEGVPARICLQPGEYKLAEPVLIRRNDLTIEACTGEATLTGGSAAVFRRGMVCAARFRNITLRSLVFRPGETPLETGALLGLSVAEMVERLGGPRFDLVGTFIAVRLLDCENVRIERCRFVLPGTAKLPCSFGAAILASGSVDGFILRENAFERELAESGAEPPALEIDERDFRVWLGYAHGPVAQAGLAGEVLKGELGLATLANATFEKNSFTGYTAALLAHGDVQAVRIMENDVARCYSGFWVLTLHTMASYERVFQIDHKDLGGKLDYTTFLSDPVIQIASSLVRSLPPLAKPAKPLPFDKVPIKNPSPFQALATDLDKRFFALWAVLGRIEEAVMAETTSGRTEAQVAHNRVQTSLQKTQERGGGVERGGPALVLWGEDWSPKNKPVVPRSAAIVDGNDLRAALARPFAVVIMLFGYITVTGNVVLNPIVEGRQALLVSPGTIKPTAPNINGAAITGNTVAGGVDFPPRPNTPPFGRWEDLNNIIPG